MFVWVLLWQQVSLYFLKSNRGGRLGFPQFSHFRHVFVYSTHNHYQRTGSITKWRFDHDLDSVTALMMTDCHLQSWTDLRVPTDPSFYFGCYFVSRKSKLSTWTSKCVQFCLVEKSSNTDASPRSPWYLPTWSIVRSTEDDLEDLRIFARNFAANFVARCHRSGVIVNKFPCTFWTIKDSAS